MQNGKPTNFIKFLGTGGARFVMAEQLRATAGAWLNFDGTNIHLDPGPGALVKSLASRPRLDPRSLDGIILSHRHLDHSGDINIFIEAMTNGGFQKRGVVFSPIDALENDPVILQYLRSYPQELSVLREGGRYAIGNVHFETPVRHLHSHETYGLNLHWRDHKISWVIDTKFFPELLRHYDGEVLILHCVSFADPENRIQHLNLQDVRAFLANGNKPRLVVLTHFGRTMLANKPWEIAAQLTTEYGVPVRAASDGWLLDLFEVFPEEKAG